MTCYGSLTTLILTGYDDTGEGKVRESTTSSTEGDKYNDPVDGTKASLNVEPTDVKDTNTEAPEGESRLFIKFNNCTISFSSSFLFWGSYAVQR